MLNKQTELQGHIHPIRLIVLLSSCSLQRTSLSIYFYRERKIQAGGEEIKQEQEAFLLTWKDFISLSVQQRILILMQSKLEENATRKNPLFSTEKAKKEEESRSLQLCELWRLFFLFAGPRSMLLCWLDCKKNCCWAFPNSLCVSCVCERVKNPLHCTPTTTTNCEGNYRCR